MTTGPLIAVLAGAREVHDAVRWLSQTKARARVVWGDEADPVPVDLPVLDVVPADAAGILDASHAFDTRTRGDAVRAAPSAKYARIARDPWVPAPGDHWDEVNTIEQAVAALPSGARVFAATGRASVSALACHRGAVYLRQLTQHAFPSGFANCTYVFGPAPFDAAGEAELLCDLKIDIVIARNVGGPDSFPKIEAARDLGLPVILLRAPHAPSGPRLRSGADVAAWVAGL